MSKTKRQDIPGTLWVIATPIGNLEDLSPRAKRHLTEADFVLCEDTRQGAKLLAAAGIGASMSRLERLDAHSGEKQLGQWVNRMQGGEKLALITDAGTPAISDPGAGLVREAQLAGIAVIPIPGPSAVVTLLSVAGFGETAFTFRGFFPRKAPEREAELNHFMGSPLSQVGVWFESPHRISESVELIASQFPDVELVIAKELTKVYERFFCGRATDVCRKLKAELDREGALGEWVFAIRFTSPESSTQAVEESKLLPDSEVWIKSLQCLRDSGVSASVAASQVSQHFGAPKKTVYDLALKTFGKKK